MIMSPLNAPERPTGAIALPPRTIDPAEMLDDLGDEDFRRLADVIERRTGIHLPATKRAMVTARLRGCARRLGLTSLDDYCRYLFDRGGMDRDLPLLVDALTTNKTDFFRESDHFTCLTELVLPDLLSGGSRDLAVWSAACSTGPEAYTLAMVLDSAAHQPGNAFRFHVFASDICGDVLCKAERGIYAADMVAPVPPAYRDRYVMTSRDKADNRVRIVPELRRMVSFASHNLLSARSPWGRCMDIIFCRNVLIYFTRATQEQVIANLCRQLRVGGYLFLGHSESTVNLTLPLEQVRPSIYRRRR